MIQSKDASLFADEVAVQVRAGDRFYPAGRELRPEAKNGRRFGVLKLRLAKAPTLSESLGDALWDRLAFAKFSATSLPKESPPLLRSYVDSLNQITSFQREVTELIRATCEANYEFRQGSGRTNEQRRNEIRQRVIGEQLAQIPEWKTVDSVLDATAGTITIGQLYARLESALRRSLARFTAQFVETLDSLVDAQIVGLIDWVGRNACRYHFFTRVVIQDNDGKRKTETVTLFGSPRETEGRSVVGETVTSEIESGRHTVRWGRHEHHVIDAFQTTVANSNVVMPPVAMTLIEAIPDWLRDFVRVVDGDICSQRVVERDARTVDWEVGRELDRKPIYGCEPAIFIDRFVLTGWGPREDQAEKDRRSAIQQTEQAAVNATQASGERWVWLSGAVVSVLAAVCLAQTSFRSISDAMLCLGVTAFFATTQTVRSHGVAVGTRSSLLHYFAGNTIVAAILVSGFMIGFWREFHLLKDGVTGVVGIVFSGLCLVQIRRLWPPRSTSPRRGALPGPER